MAQERSLMPKAPRVCPHTGCTTLVKHNRYCPEHQPPAWPGERTASSKITSTHKWKTFKRTILERDRYQCQLRYDGCTRHATQVDKIQPAARRPELAFNPNNARAACRSCNQLKARTTDRAR